MNIVKKSWNKILDFFIIIGRKCLPNIFYRKIYIKGEAIRIARFITEKELYGIKEQFHQQQDINKLYPTIKKPI